MPRTEERSEVAHERGAESPNPRARPVRPATAQQEHPGESHHPAVHPEGSLVSEGVWKEEDEVVQRERLGEKTAHRIAEGHRADRRIRSHEDHVRPNHIPEGDNHRERIERSHHQSQRPRMLLLWGIRSARRVEEFTKKSSTHTDLKVKDSFLSVAPAIPVRLRMRVYHLFAPACTLLVLHLLKRGGKGEGEPRFGGGRTAIEVSPVRACPNLDADTPQTRFNPTLPRNRV